MIAYLKGKVQRKEADSLVVTAGQVGYLVFATTETVSQAGDEVELQIYTHITENSMSLYGFKEMADMKLFQVLISVSGIGPKLAIAILGYPASTIATAILSSDVAVLTEIPGVGKKMAERMIVELKSKMEELPLVSVTPQSNNAAEAIQALEALGYSKSEATEAVANCDSKTTDTNDIIKAALQYASGA